MPICWFRYHIEILSSLSSRMLRRVSLLTALLYMELYCLLHQPFMTSYPEICTVNCLFVCTVIMVAKLCGLSEGTSNCHFRSLIFVCFMYGYLQFGLMDICRDIERAKEEFTFIISNPLFELCTKIILNTILFLWGTLHCI